MPNAQERGILGPTTRKVLEVTVRFWAEHGYSPSLRDIGGEVNIVPSLVAYHLAHLRTGGWIAYDDGVARSIRVIRKEAQDVR